MIPEISEIETAFMKVVGSEPLPTSEIISQLRSSLDLSPEQAQCLTACGRQRRFDNRVIYVRTKLRREGFIEVDRQKRVWRISREPIK